MHLLYTNNTYSGSNMNRYDSLKKIRRNNHALS